MSIEAKKRGPIKRAKLERNESDRKKPQEIREEDIQRAENETTKNVIQVCMRDHFAFLLFDAWPA